MDEFKGIHFVELLIVALRLLFVLYVWYANIYKSPSNSIVCDLARTYSWRLITHTVLLKQWIGERDAQHGLRMETAKLMTSNKKTMDCCYGAGKPTKTPFCAWARHTFPVPRSIQLSLLDKYILTRPWPQEDIKCYKYLDSCLHTRHGRHHLLLQSRF